VGVEPGLLFFRFPIGLCGVGGVFSMSQKVIARYLWIGGEKKDCLSPKYRSIFEGVQPKISGQAAKNLEI
jgi:hypothetical protein